MITPQKTEAELDAFIREKCVASNESILDLVFGCEIKLERPKDLEVYIGGFVKPKSTGNTDFYDTWKLIAIERNSRGTEDYQYIFSVGNFGFSNSYIEIKIDPKDYKKMFDLGKIEILGRPLQLADILLAIEKNDPDCDYHLTFEGQFAQYNPEDGDMYLTGKWWNLTLPYSSQSIETKRFLAELLGINRIICH